MIMMTTKCIVFASLLPFIFLILAASGASGYFLTEDSTSENSNGLSSTNGRVRSAGPNETGLTGPDLIRLGYASKATGREREFYVFLPEGYGLDDATSNKEPFDGWPVILFLHGNGERGNAQDELGFALIHGPVYEAWVQKRSLPFVMIVPQLPMYGMGEVDYIANRNHDRIPQRLEEGVPPRRPASRPDFPMKGQTPASPDSMPHPPEGPPDGWYRLEQDLLDILDTVDQRFAIDPDRVYLTGISYGGFGTWYMAARHPERFAAIAPVVGYGHPAGVDPIAEHELPVWCFAGGRDRVVEPRYFYPTMNRLEELGHDNIRFTIHEDMGHDTWVRVYKGRDLYDWFLEHRRSDRAGW